MKFFRNSLFIIATVFLISSCNVEPSTSASSSVQSSTSASSALVSNILIETESPLNQVLGLNNTTKVNAKISGVGDINSLNVDWILNGVKSTTQSGDSFEFFANQSVSYLVQARIGDKFSNTLEFKADYPSFSLNDVRVINSKQLRVYSLPGINFSGNFLIDVNTSSYSLGEGFYTLNLINDMIQGNSYTINANRSGFKTQTYTFVYDTRQLSLVSLVLDSNIIKPDSTGVFNIERPFTTGDSNKTYLMRLSHKNLEATNSVYVFSTSAPVNATGSIVASEQKTVNVIKDQEITTASLTITKDTLPGLYIHSISVGGKSIEVKINIIKPVPYVKLETDFMYGPSGGTVGSYSHNGDLFTTTVSGQPSNFTYAVKPEADGSYIINRPYNGAAKEFAFRLAGDFFTTPVGQSNSHLILVGLSGPQGNLMTYGSNQVNITPTFSNFDRKFGISNSGAEVRISQFVDSKTVLGTYRYNLTVGLISTGEIINKTIVVVVRELAPKLEGKVSINTLDVKPVQGTNRFIIDKPISGVTFDYKIALKVTNYESPNASIAQATTFYSTTKPSASAQNKFLLDYSMNYSGPLSGITPINSKVAIELGIPSDRLGTDSTDRTPNGTVVDSVTSINENPTKTYNRLASSGDNIEYVIAWGTIDASYLPGDHNYTIRIGGLVQTFTLQIQNSSPRVLILEDEITYGGSNSNISFNAQDGKYYVDGKGSNLDLKPRIAGLGEPSSALPYTFSIRTPSGAVTSTTNSVLLSLDTDNTSNPFYGTLEFPAAGSAGSEMAAEHSLLLEGEYRFDFNVNGITKTVYVVVLPAPQIRVESISFAGEELIKFNNRYLIMSSASERSLMVKAKPNNIDSGSKFTVQVSNDNVTYGALSPAINLQVIQLQDGFLYFDIKLASGDANRYYKITIQSSDNTDPYLGSEPTIIWISAQAANNVSN